MSQLQLNGTLLYPSGLWGGSGPAAGLSVEIIQNSVLPASQTTIWSGTTDDSGNFSGKSSEWRRTISVTVGQWSHDEPDPADILALTCHIIDDTGPSRQEKTFPFVWLGDQLPSPAILLTWNPPTARKGRVNGADCWSISDLARRARLGARTPLTIEFYLYGPDAAQSASKLRSVVTDVAAFAASTISSNSTSIAQRLLQKNNALGSLTLKPLQLGQTIRQAQGQPIAANVGRAGAGTLNAGQVAAAVPLALVEIVVAIVVTVLGISVVAGTVIPAVTAAAAAESILMSIEVAMAVGGVIGATVAVIGDLPALLLQVAALLDAMGCGGDADFVRDASSGLGQWYAQNAWFGLVLDLCIVVVLLVVAMLRNSVAFVAQIVSGPEGQSGLRLQTSS